HVIQQSEGRVGPMIQRAPLNVGDQIRSGDSVTLEIYAGDSATPEAGISTSYKIGDDRLLRIEQFFAVVAAARTPGQLASEIARRLQDGFIGLPRVCVTLDRRGDKACATGPEGPSAADKKAVSFLEYIRLVPSTDPRLASAVARYREWVQEHRG